MASGWGDLEPLDGDADKRRYAKELQFIWIKVVSLSDCNDLAIKAKQDDKCTMMPSFDNEKNKATSNLTLCVVNPGNPKKGVESGESLTKLDGVGPVDNRPSTD